jgi:hypothetical protein
MLGNLGEKMPPEIFLTKVRDHGHIFQGAFPPFQRSSR